MCLEVAPRYDRIHDLKQQDTGTGNKRCRGDQADHRHLDGILESAGTLAYLHEPLRRHFVKRLDDKAVGPALID